MPVRLGSMGRAMPGHDVSLVDKTGQEVEDTGIVAVRRGDPVMFLEYWNDPDATHAKFKGDWLLTGDIARRESMTLDELCTHIDTRRGVHSRTAAMRLFASAYFMEQVSAR